MQSDQSCRRRAYSLLSPDAVIGSRNPVLGSALLVVALAVTFFCAPANAGTDPAQTARQVDKLLASDPISPEPAATKPVATLADAKPSADAANSEKWTDGSKQNPQSSAGKTPAPAPSAQASVRKAAARSVSTEKLPVADDETFIRRVTLDLLGEQPSPDAIAAFLLDPSSDKRANLVDRLLANPSYGHNWARYWRDVVLYRRSDDRANLMAGTLVNYLTDELNRNAAWDEIAQSFITANGDILENGQTGLIMAQQASPEDTTAEVSRIFLGVQIQCAQCHNHPTDRWKREQFHELAAFFTRITVRPVRLDDNKRSFRVAGDDRGIGPRSPGMADPVALEHHMPDLKDPHAKGTPMQPVFFATGQQLKPGASDRERRETIAKWITAPQNTYFAEAFVNRMWSELVGHGFVEPVDDMSPDRPVQSPQTLKYLAEQFTANRYDIKWLMRAITSTEAYQRQSRSRGEIADPLATSGPQRLRADQLTNALLDALCINESSLGRGFARGYAGQAQDDTAAKNAKSAGAAADEARKPANAGNGPKRRGLNQTPRGVALQTFGYDPSVRRDEVAGTIPQALWLMNSDLVSAGTSGDPASGLGKLLASEPNDESVGVELYLRCLAREPKPAELSMCLAHVRSAGRQQGFEDILWSLLNSTEFLYRK